MKKIDLGRSGLLASEIALGCMRMNSLSKKEAQRMIETAVEAGINFFDHADIYGKGKSEEIFAEGLKGSTISRDKIVLQSKCGIKSGVMYDFSKEHIIESVEGSLKRLQTDHLDTLLLHRPDALMEPEEIAEAFTELRQSGKVGQFGVSNFSPYQVELLQKALPQRLIVNQLQYGLKHTGMVDAGINVNRKDPSSTDHDGGILDYSRLKEMTIQAWSPYQSEEGVIMDSSVFPKLNEKMDQLANEKGVSAMAIAAAWILRHPARIQVIAGTMNTDRLQAIATASDIELSRREWYDLYLAAGNELP